LEEVLYCGYCNKELKDGMEIEYSSWLGEYFCCPDCATSKYYDYMGSKPLEKDFYKDHDIRILKDGSLLKGNNE
jgi:hypothetical protein